MNRRIAIALCLATLVTACATPPEGAPLLGSTEATKLADGRYQVFASINGYTHPATLKGFISRQAQKTAKAEGFQAFEIERLIRPATVDGWHMVALVTLYNTPPSTSPHAYTVNADGSPNPIAYGRALDVARPAKLVGLSRRDGMTHWESYMPLFVDTVAVDHNPLRDMSGGLTEAILSVPAGEQVVVTEVRLHRGFGSGGPWTQVLPIKADLKPGGEYRINGAVVGEDLEVWIEDRSTAAPAGPRVKAKFKAPGPREIRLQ